LREFREETGITASHPQFVALTNDIFAAEHRHYLTVWVRVEYLSGEARLAAPEESTEIGWFGWDDLPQPLFLPMQNLLAGRHYPANHQAIMAKIKN